MEVAVEQPYPESSAANESLRALSTAIPFLRLKLSSQAVLFAGFGIAKSGPWPKVK